MYQLSVFIHVVAAIVWVGGMLFLPLIAVPATRRLPLAERGALFTSLGRRFRKVGWACIALLLVTGLGILGLRGVTWESVTSGRLPESEFGRVLAAKLLLILAMLALTLVHDVVLGPASSRALADPSPDAALVRAKLRRRTGAVSRPPRGW